MSKTSTLILSDTSDQLEITGAKFRADWWFGFSDGNHTVGWYMTAFIGRVSLEVSLETVPTDSDWVAIVAEGDTDPYLEFTNFIPGDGLVLKNYIGNFIWVRGIVTRSHLTPTPAVVTVGILRKALLNF